VIKECQGGLVQRIDRGKRRKRDEDLQHPSTMASMSALGARKPGRAERGTQASD
jgi:hypothetical protein